MPPSYWIETSAETSYRRLEADLDVDVAVVGGGITGVTTALFLKEAGKTVALVEMKRLGHGVTGYTTAKLTSGHASIYRKLRSSHGAEVARLYAESNQAALERMAGLVEERGIECDFERADNYVYSESSSDVEELRDEVEAAREAGLDATFVTETELPFPVAGAVRLPGQAQFHPRKYLLALAAAVEGDGSHVFERTRAVGLGEGRPCVVRTQGGSIRAGDVVLATHLPFADRGLHFAKAHPQMSYAVAAPADEAPRGMYISLSQPTRSIRSTPFEGGRLLVVGGEGHKPGAEADTRRRYEALERTLAERFGLEDVRYRWSTHDYVPVDDLPYIGRLRRGSEHVYVATGFAKWGLTKGTIAATVISDAILGRESPWAEVYDAARLDPRRSAVSFLKENGFVAARFAGDRLRPGETDAESLATGEGAVVRSGRRRLAVHRDETGELRVLSARCTHLGCIVGWNTAEQTWDCPCHGSRFAADGTVIEGPAVADLPRESL